MIERIFPPKTMSLSIEKKLAKLMNADKMVIYVRKFFQENPIIWSLKAFLGNSH